MNLEEAQAQADFFAPQMLEARKEKLDTVISNRTRYFTLVLEDLYNPHNISAIIRTSEVFGLQDVHVIEEVNPFVVSQGILMGSAKWIDLYKYKKRTHCLQNLRKRGYQIAVASTNTHLTLDQCDLSKPTAFYLGAELKGNHPDTLESADIHFKIPQYGLTESMNVSVCAGVLLTHLLHYMKVNGRESYTLSPEEQIQLRARFYKNSVMGIQKQDAIKVIEDSLLD
jgi:tRNA (guanosine-2'-O-)-methyltransferase